MAGTIRFLYGLALGISLGIIGSRLLAAASSNHHHRHIAGSVRQRPAARALRRERSRQAASAR